MKSITKPYYRSLVLNKVHGGKNSLWHARHPECIDIIGAGNTADNAIRDWSKQYDRYIAFRRPIGRWFSDNALNLPA